MNFLEHRLYADRALSKLIRMAREATPETLSSREQRGVFRLEAILVEKSSTAVSARASVGSNFVARCTAFSIIVLMVIQGFWQERREHRQRAGAALWWARAVIRHFLARAFMALRARVYRSVGRRELRAPERAPERRPRDPGSIWLEP